MDLKKIIELLKEGENERAEFKTSITKDSAKDLVGMLNTYGGYILFGITDKGEIKGLSENEREIKKKIEERVLQPIVPTPRVKTGVIKIGERRIGWIEAKMGEKLYTIGNVAYTRIG